MRCVHSGSVVMTVRVAALAYFHALYAFLLDHFQQNTAGMRGCITQEVCLAPETFTPDFLDK